MIVINFFAGPSSGKSTTAAYVFSQLKLNNISCQYINEYAKDCVYEGRNTVVQNDQLYILAKQNHKLKMLELSGQADYAIVDSPLILSNIYGQLHHSITEAFEKFTLELFNSYENYNFFIKRKPECFESNGRYQKNIEEAEAIDHQIYNYLNNNNIKFDDIAGVNDFPFHKIIKDIKNGD